MPCGATDGVAGNDHPICSLPVLRHYLVELVANSDDHLVAEGQGAGQLGMGLQEGEVVVAQEMIFVVVIVLGSKAVSIQTPFCWT